MMSKKSKKVTETKNAVVEPEDYKSALNGLQIELVKLQRHLIRNNLRILILFEGRDASGKDGVVKRITEYLSPRDTRVVALGKPSDRDTHSWYFQRYVAELPATGEMVLMNRSWYNRAGVEKVMGFCTKPEHEEFMQSVLPFERLLVRSGTQVFKYYLDISKPEQKRRLHNRRVDPLKQWKVSPIDKTALRHWDDYSVARNEMLARTHSDDLPWYVVRADDKKLARLRVIRHLMSRVDCPDKDKHLAEPDLEIVFGYAEEHLQSGAIAP